MYDVMKKADRRFWIVQDDRIIGEAGTYEDALDMVYTYQRRETHYMLRSEFQIVEVNAHEFVSYKAVRQ